MVLTLFTPTHYRRAKVRKQHCIHPLPDVTLKVIPAQAELLGCHAAAALLLQLLQDFCSCFTAVTAAAALLLQLLHDCCSCSFTAVAAAALLLLLLPDCCSCYTAVSTAAAAALLLMHCCYCRRFTPPLESKIWNTCNKQDVQSVASMVNITLLSTNDTNLTWQ